MLDEFYIRCQTDLNKSLLKSPTKKNFHPSFFCQKKTKWARDIDHLFFARAQSLGKEISDAEIDEIYNIAFDYSEAIFKIVFDSP